VIFAALNGGCSLIRPGHVELDSEPSIRVSAGKLVHRADGPGSHDDTFAFLKDVLSQCVAQSAGCSSDEPSGLRIEKFLSL
jgi:hypothetical protein